MSDAAAALIKDGEIIAACEEERFTRKKHDGDFPKNAIDFCLNEAGITYKDLDYVGYYFKPWYNFYKRIFRVIQYLPASLKIGLMQGNKWLKILKIKDYIKEYFGLKNDKFPFKFIFVEHHLAHAASSFFVSPFKEAAILTMDESGEHTSIMFSHGVNNRINKIRSIGHPHSVGEVYKSVTSYLGFPHVGDEGKVMGLASYGKAEIPLEKIVAKMDKGDFHLHMRYFDYYTGVSKQFIKEFGQARIPDSNIEKKHQDMAFALQKLTEKIGLKFADYLYNITGSENICLAGGVALNCVMNGRILSESKFKNVFVQPAACDAGGAIGAAFSIYNNILGHERKYIMQNSLLGKSYTEKEIKDFLDRKGIKYEYRNDMTKFVARLIASGKIVGWFSGKMEFGPRALGGRSILADPRRAEMKDILNKRVKHRESFRPFAPSVLKEDAKLYFENASNSPFMLLTFPVKKEMRDVIPAITHVDGSARVQTVDKKALPRYWELINNFKKITGIGVILNTSFNIRGEPIVCSLEDAYNCYINTGIDYLVLENFILTKNA
jgi:carbamoyltransferase|tara:strand:- start:1640 stop:3289 length:1650 start_codon:yes stop_codon:yes gene_type:complete